MKIKEYFQSLVKAGTIPQEPMDYDAATLKIYIDYLETENAALRERLEKAVELPCKVGDIIYQHDNVDKIYASKIRKIIYETEGIAFDESAINNSIFLTRAAAEKRLAELVGRR